MVRVLFKESLDYDQGDEGERQEHLVNAAAGGGFHRFDSGSVARPDPAPGERDRIRSQAAPALERRADREELASLSRLRVDGPDRGGRGADESARALLATANPLAALEFQSAGVEGLSHSSGP